MPAIPSLTIWVLAWLFLIIGLVSLAILVIYTKYGRELSIKLYLISIFIASIFLGFSVHFFMLNYGI